MFTRDYQFKLFEVPLELCELGINFLALNLADLYERVEL